MTPLSDVNKHFNPSAHELILETQALIMWRNVYHPPPSRQSFR